MEMTRRELMNGVHLTYLPAGKFKTNLISAQFVLPLTRETASWNALLPNVLHRGTMRYPDMESLSKAMDLLYGAQISGTVRKKGENLCIGFVGSFLEEKYLPEKAALLEPVTALMGELLCDPATTSGRFIPAYVEGEKQNLIDLIRSSINDKRDYAAKRLIQEMCGDEPYGVMRLGDEKSVKKINNGKLFLYYQNLLATAPLELCYCGLIPPDRVERAFREAFASLPRQNIQPWGITQRRPAPETPRYVTEEMDVTQGKLSMGFRCESRDWAALMLANMLFGGSSTSKLFMNVRERLSLCYYASSSYHRVKGIITVQSGIECEKYQTVHDEILAQLAAVQRGEWEEWEKESALRMLINALNSLGDSAGQMEDFFLSQTVLDLGGTPESIRQQLLAVDDERICLAAQSIKLDTVYFLKGGESHE